MKRILLLAILSLSGCGDLLFDDCEEVTICRHIPTDTEVDVDECLRGDRPRIDPKAPDTVDNQDVDPRANPPGQAYFETKADYESLTVCR